MKIDEILDLWKKDSELDRTELGEESLRISQLHYKYYKIFSEERLLARKLESDFKKLKRLKFEYYNGTIAEDDLRANGWEPFTLKVLKTDLNTYFESDEDLDRLSLRISLQNEKVTMLENIIKSLPARGYQIKSAIDWERFKVGA
ncbi:MAG: hypothetical protein EBY41_02250 [Proteobacteria bacterium]|jgi:hypothetical protein|nr:hypothetical protein [Pseudomonadota bacterium]